MEADGDQVRVAAIDTAGNLLSDWSKPAMLTVLPEQVLSRLTQKTAATKAAAAPDQAQPAGQPATDAAQDTSQMESTATAAAADGSEPPPAGNTLQINAKTPLYEENKPSSRELATLEKGEQLIHISTNGLWERVYYPRGKQRGWVLSFYVDSVN